MAHIMYDQTAYLIFWWNENVVMCSTGILEPDWRQNRFQVLLCVNHVQQFFQLDHAILTTSMSVERERSLSPGPSTVSGHESASEVRQRTLLRSPVWNFFSFVDASGMSVCQVLQDGSVCSQKIKGKYPINLYTANIRRSTLLWWKLSNQSRKPKRRPGTKSCYFPQSSWC